MVPVHAMVATGINRDGHHEILGIQVSTAKDGSGWLSFFRELTARGLSGVKPVWGEVSDLECPRWVEGSDCCDPTGCSLAAVPHPLCGQPDEHHPEGLLDLSQDPAAQNL